MTANSNLMFSSEILCALHFVYGWLAWILRRMFPLFGLLTLGATTFAATTTTSRPSGSILAGHADAYFAQTASGVVHLSAGNKHGTGICLDTPCTHVLTNYHVVAFLGEGLKAENTGVIKVTAATGPNDEAARSIQGLHRTFVFRFDPARDLAVVTLREPLPRRFRGLDFATYRPTQNQPVIGIAYDPPRAILADLGLFSVRRGRLRMSEGEIRLLDADVISPVDNRLAAVEGSLLLSFPSNAGNSGGAVVDSDGRVIGIICGAALVPGRTDGEVTGTLALPAASVLRFLREREPELWAKAFSGYPMPAEAPNDTAEDGLARREGEPVVRGPIAALNLDSPPVLAEGIDPIAMVEAAKRRAAERLSAMQNVFAEQQLEMWGGDNQRREIWHHEVAIYKGGQTFREIKADGTRGKSLSQLPQPRAGARPGDEWSSLLRRIAKAATPLTYLGTSTYKGKTVRAYGYAVSAENKVCDYMEYVNGVVGSATWKGYVDCAGAILTDELFNPIAILQELYPPLDRFTSLLRITVRYDFVPLPGGGAPSLLPSDLRLAIQFNDGGWRFASAIWRDYHQFKVSSSVKFEAHMLNRDAPPGLSPSQMQQASTEDSLKGSVGHF